MVLTYGKTPSVPISTVASKPRGLNRRCAHQEPFGRGSKGPTITEEEEASTAALKCVWVLARNAPEEAIIIGYLYFLIPFLTNVELLRYSVEILTL